MDTDQEQAPTEAAPDSTQTVRVPNVSPGAKSGLDHHVIGSDALAQPADGAAYSDGSTAPEVLPDGDLDARVQWVQVAEDADTARARADVVWAAYGGGDPDSDLAAGTDLDDLSGRLTAAVHGGGVQGQEVTDAPLAGTGAAVNADTGEVTQPGDPLPPIEQDGGDPLPPVTSPAQEEQGAAPTDADKT